MKRYLFALTTLLLTFGSMGAALAQNEEAPVDAEPSGPAALSAYTVDATGKVVTIALVADRFEASIDSASVIENDEERKITSLSRATKVGLPVEIMLVVDTRQGLAQGNALDLVKKGLIGALDDLPAGTKVGLVQASGSAILSQELTTDLSLVKEAIGALDLAASGSVIDGIERAAQQFENRPVGVLDRSLASEPIRSILVFSAGEDLSSTASAPGVASSAVRKGAQVFTVRYEGGEDGLGEVIDTAAGITFTADGTSDIGDSLGAALAASSDRIFVSYEGLGDQAIRSDVTVRVGGVETELSFGNGRFSGTPNALTAVEPPSLSGPAFLRSSTGLMISLVLAFLGVALAIYSVGSLFFAGDVTLEAMLDRYANEGDSADLSSDETSLVQTALVQRAVELSESFAEDRGFLAKIEELLEQANVTLRPGEAMSFLMAGMVIGGAVGTFLTHGIFGGFIVSILTGFGMFYYIRFKGKRRQKKFEKQLPDMLQLLAGTLKAGYSLPQGLEAVSHEIDDPMGYEIRRAMTETRLGREIEESLDTVAERMKSPDFAWAVMAISIQREVGGNLNELLMTVAETMIARERLKGEVAALTAEGKMTAILLGGLPPGLGLVMWVMNPEYIETLFTNTLGNILLGFGLLSMVVGMAWMKKVMTVDV